MQSAVPHVLKVLDRTHNVENLPLVVAAAKAAGLATSVDLIYGAPTESLEDFGLSLAAAIALDPDHISAYSLIVEPGTKLARQIKVGELPEPDEDEQADKYLMADSMLADAGFDWYEISNWAKSEAQRSKHNLAYWQSQDWWGFGPGAHSHIGGTRWWNVKHPSAYAGKLQANASPTQARELLDEKTQAVEKVLLEMRIRAGISIDRIKMASDQPERVAGVVADAIARDLIEAKAAIGGQLVLTLPGRLIADALLRELLG
jgi:oxygen-independent coproporphyrinogen-3 oxidase